MTWGAGRLNSLDPVYQLCETGFVGDEKTVVEQHYHRRGGGCLATIALLILYGMFMTACEPRSGPEPEDPPAAEVETELKAQPEYVPLYEIWGKWIDERERYNDPASFVFSGWKRPGGIRTTGLVFEKVQQRDLSGQPDGFDVYFHDGNGEKDLLDGVWKWTGRNRGVYAHFDDISDMEKIEIDEHLTVTCTHVEPQVDRESGMLFGLELQNCEPESVPASE